MTLTYKNAHPASVLIADPPWKFKDSLPGKGRGAAKHYACMTITDLAFFPLPPLLPDCYLLLWRVAAMASEAEWVARKWGFEPFGEFVWRKVTVNGKRHMGMGHHVRGEHEVCRIAKRGRPKPLRRDVRTIFDGVVRGHSEKPDEFYDLVESWASPPYTELFARRRRFGWQSFGDEL